MAGTRPDAQIPIDQGAFLESYSALPARIDEKTAGYERAGYIIVDGIAKYKAHYQISVVYNCWGDLIVARHERVIAYLRVACCPDVIWAWPKYLLVISWEMDRAEGVLQDIRSLELLRMGCCPIELSNEILGVEGTPD